MVDSSFFLPVFCYFICDFLCATSHRFSFDGVRYVRRVSIGNGWRAPISTRTSNIMGRHVWANDVVEIIAIWWCLSVSVSDWFLTLHHTCVCSALAKVHSKKKKKNPSKPTNTAEATFSWIISFFFFLFLRMHTYTLAHIPRSLSNDLTMK